MHTHIIFLFPFFSHNKIPAKQLNASNATICQFPLEKNPTILNAENNCSNAPIQAGFPTEKNNKLQWFPITIALNSEKPFRIFQPWICTIQLNIGSFAILTNEFKLCETVLKINHCCVCSLIWSWTWIEFKGRELNSLTKCQFFGWPLHKFSVKGDEL